MSIVIQYIIVGLILAGALVYIIVKILRLRGSDRPGSCAGCSLSENCNKKNRHKTYCHENDKDME